MEETQTLFSLRIDPVTKLHLGETARWARFLAVFGIIVLCLITAASIFGITVMDQLIGRMNLNSGSDYYVSDFSNPARIAMAFSTIVMFVIGIFPLIYLLRFANKMKTALAGNNQEALNISFQNLKRYFRYLGIIIIIFLIIYALFFVIAIIGGVAMSR